MIPKLQEIYLIRHGETDWASIGRHTGRRDLPLNEKGCDEARQLQARLAGIEFDRVLVSTLQRAQATCRLAGFEERAQKDARLVEWNYGDFEGKTQVEIQQIFPGWNVFSHGCPGGETVEEVVARADSVVADLATYEGRTVIFAHGHFLRVLGARWCRLGMDVAKGLLLQTTGVCVLGYDKNLQQPVIRLWNQRT